MILDLLCEKCWYNEYDEETDECFCSLVLDEDEYVRFCEEQNKTCRYFRPSGSEYDIVRKQNKIANKMNSNYSSYFFAVDKYGIGVYNKNTLMGYKE